MNRLLPLHNRTEWSLLTSWIHFVHFHCQRNRKQPNNCSFSYHFCCNLWIHTPRDNAQCLVKGLNGVKQHSYWLRKNFSLFNCFAFRPLLKSIYSIVSDNFLFRNRTSTKNMSVEYKRKWPEEGAHIHDQCCASVWDYVFGRSHNKIREPAVVLSQSTGRQSFAISSHSDEQKLNVFLMPWINNITLRKCEMCGCCETGLTAHEPDTIQSFANKIRDSKLCYDSPIVEIASKLEWSTDAFYKYEKARVAGISDSMRSCSTNTGRNIRWDFPLCVCG